MLLTRSATSCMSDTMPTSTAYFLCEIEFHLLFSYRASFDTVAQYIAAASHAILAVATFGCVAVVVMLKPELIRTSGTCA